MLEMCLSTWLSILIAIAIAFKLFMKFTAVMCKCTKRLDGKTVLITGGNTGIGKEVAMDMAKRGARVILACLDMKIGKLAQDEIISASGNSAVVIRRLDLTSLSCVREFAREVLASGSRLDVLINNAGAANLKEVFSKDGLQVVMQVNHYGPFLLTNLLLDLMKKTAPSRIIFVSSILHRVAIFDKKTFKFRRWIGFQEYCVSKLFSLLTSNTLAEKLKGTGVTVNSLHPGFIYSGIWSHIPVSIMRYFWKTVEEGAQTTIHLAVSEKLEGVTGKYFVDCKVKPPSATALDKNLAKRVWDLSMERVKLSPLEANNI